MKIAIVGAGLSGSNVLKNLIEKKYSEINEIVVYEYRAELSKGLAYESDSDVKLLNVKSKDMSMTDDPDDFLNWLTKSNLKKYNFEGMTPRTYYGEYLEDHFNKYFKDEKVKIVNEEVVDINILNSNYIKVSTENSIDTFSHVFLCIGHPKYKDPYNLEGNPRFIQNMYPMNKHLSSIKKSDCVGIIGTGASSLDAFRYLKLEKGQSGKIYFLTRSSIFNMPRPALEDDKFGFNVSIDDKWIENSLDDNENIPLSKLISVVDSDLVNLGVNILEEYENVKESSFELYAKLVELNSQKHAYIIEYFEKLTPYISKLYGLLTDSDREIFNTRYKKIYDKFRTLTPIKTMKWLINEMENGSVKVLKDLVSIKNKATHFEVDAEDKINLDWVINTTGFDLSLSSNAKTNPLINSLLKREIISPQKDRNSIDIEWPSCKVISNKYGTIPNLFLVSMWSKGKFFEPNHARTIRYLASDVVEGLRK